MGGAVMVGVLEAILRLRDEMTPALRNATSNLQQTGAALQRVGGQMQAAGGAMTAGITLPIVGVATAAVRAGLDFERSMNQIKGVVRPTAAEMEKIRAKAVEMGAATIFSATDAANAMLELGKAGFTAEQSMAAVDEVLQLAAASGLSMAEAAEMSARTMAAFNLEIDDLGHVNDVLAKAVNASTLEITDLQTAFRYIGPLAVGVGMSIEQTSAAIAIMRDNGVAAETAGRGLREALDRLLNPTKAVRDGLAELGVSVYDANGQLLPFEEIIRILGPHAGNTAAMLQIFGGAAGPGMVALLSEGHASLERLTADLENSHGAAKDMADAMMEGLPGAFERLRGSVETALLSISKALEPTLIPMLGLLERAADVITNTLVPAFQRLPTPVQASLVVMTALAAAAGPMLFAIGSVVRILGIAVTGFGTLSRAMFLVGNTVPVLTARLWLMQAAGGAVAAALGFLASGVGLVAAAFAGWNIGQWIGELRLFGEAQMSVAESFEFGATKIFNWIRGIKASDADIETAILSRRKLAEATKDGAKASEQAAQMGLIEGDAMQQLAIADAAAAAAKTQVSEASKQYAEKLADIRKELSGGGAIEKVNDLMAAFKGSIPVTQMTKEAQREVLEILQAGIAAWEAAGIAVPDSVAKQYEALMFYRGIPDILQMIHESTKDLAVQVEADFIASARANAEATADAQLASYNRMRGAQIAAVEAAKDLDFKRAEFAIEQAKRSGVHWREIYAMEAGLSRARLDRAIADAAEEFRQKTMFIDRTTTFGEQEYAAFEALHNLKVQAMVEDWSRGEAVKRDELRRTHDVWFRAWEGFKAVAIDLEQSVGHMFSNMLLYGYSFRDGLLNVWRTIRSGIAQILADIVNHFVHSFIRGMLGAMTGNRNAFQQAFAGFLPTALGGGGGGGLPIPGFGGGIPIPGLGGLLGGGGAAAAGAFIPGAVGGLPAALAAENAAGLLAPSGAAAGGGAGASLGAFFTNPWTIGIGGALALGLGIWKKGWFRGGEEALHVNPARDAFLAQFGDVANKDVGGAGHNLAARLTELTGEHGGGHLFRNLQSADTMKEFESARAAIESRLAESSTRASESSGPRAIHIGSINITAPYATEEEWIRRAVTKGVLDAVGENHDGAFSEFETLVDEATAGKAAPWAPLPR